MIKYKLEKVIDVGDWDALVEETYGRLYSFQQQDGCRDRGTFHFTVPDVADDFLNSDVPEVVNHSDMGVAFLAWLKRDPDLPLTNESGEWQRNLWWSRNFYPNVQMVANDLYERGLLEAGEYTIDIDW